MGTISTPGLQKIVACNAGTLLTTPVDPIATGIRKDNSMETENYAPIKCYLDGEYVNMMNFKYVSESMQSTMFAIKKHNDWLNTNADLYVNTEPQVAGGNGDIYKFTGGNKPGLEFEVEHTPDQRILKSTWEIALPWASGQTLLDSADSETPITFTTITHKRGEDISLMRRPFFVSFQSPKTTEVLTRDEIKERKYSMKTIVLKQKETNISVVHFYLFDIMMTFRNASITKHVELLTKNRQSSLYIKEQNDGAFYDAWDFATGVLTNVPVSKNTTEDRELTLRFRRKVLRFDIAFSFGASFGGDATDGGTKGGTMVIG